MKVWEESEMSTLFLVLGIVSFPLAFLLAAKISTPLLDKGDLLSTFEAILLLLAIGGSIPLVFLWIAYNLV
jgi:hypothetical protein